MKLLLLLLTYFITPDILFHHQQESKVNHFGEKAKKLQKLSKIMTFCKKLTSVTFDFWDFLNMSDSVRQMSFSEQETRFNINMIFRAKFEKSHFWPPPPPTCQKGQQRVIQGQSSLKDLLFFHQIMAACKNSANPNGPVTRSRIKPSFFICYTLERLWPLPQPKRLRCDIVHGHLGVTTVLC